MPSNAFKGDAALKSKIVEPLRPQWAARELIPASILKWQPEQNFRSLGAAMVQSQDRDAFEKGTGIPLELAMLCEALIQAGLEIGPDPSRPQGFSMEGPKEVLAFGMEWIDAVRPGADLSNVVPLYMIDLLSTILADGFVLVDHIEPEVRAAATEILLLWIREWDGEEIEPKAWRVVRGLAMKACEASDDPWGFPIAGFVEAIAWPVKGLAPEFVTISQSVMVNWLDFLERPYLSEQDQADHLLDLRGRQALTKARSNPEFNDKAVEELLDSMPDVKRAMQSRFQPDVKARRSEAKLRARAVTVPVLRQRMNTILNLIESA